MKYLLCFLIVVLAFQTSCKTQGTNSKSGIISFDLAANDKQLYFVFAKDSSYSVCVIDFLSGRYSTLLSIKDSTISNVKISPNQQNLLYIKCDSKMSCDLFNYDVIDKTDTRILKGKENLLDAVFSNDGSEILYIKANSFGNYSPIAAKQFHNVDIYSVSKDGSGDKRLTNFNSYGIFSINNLLNDMYVLKIVDSTHTGIYKLSVNDPQTLIDLNPVKHSEVDNILYYNPCYSQLSNKVALNSLSRIYLMDGKDKEEKIIKDKIFEGVNGLQFLHLRNELLFTTDSNEVNFIDFNGKQLKSITIDPFKQ